MLFFEHKGLYGTKGDVDPAAPPEPLGTARVRRAGTDVTIVGTQLMAARALAAADELAAGGVEAEVIDLRSLAPMDVATVVESASLDRAPRPRPGGPAPRAGGRRRCSPGWSWRERTSARTRPS